MLQAEYDYIFKILFIGNSAVGKSSLLVRFAEDIFTDTFLPTIGVDFKIRTIQAAGSKVKLQLWDTAGQERFKSILTSYYKGTHGILMVFDITDRSSFQDLQQWLADVQKYGKEDVVKILIGNKKDLSENRQVSQEQANRFADGLGMKYIQTSAKDSVNIEESFIHLICEMKQKFKPVIHRTSRPLTSLKANKKLAKKQTCC